MKINAKHFKLYHPHRKTLDNQKWNIVIDKE